MWYTVVFRGMTNLREIMDLMHAINAISHDWSVWADMVTFHAGDTILVCRYSGSTNYEAGRTELDRALQAFDGWQTEIDDQASRAVNRIDGARV